MSITYVLDYVRYILTHYNLFNFSKGIFTVFLAVVLHLSFINLFFHQNLILIYIL